MTRLVLSGDALTLGSLHDWLRRTRDVAAAAQIHAVPGRDAGTQSAFGTVEVVVTSAATLANVLTAYAAWRRNRSGPSGVSIRVGAYEVSADNPEDLKTLLSYVDAEGHAT